MGVDAAKDDLEWTVAEDHRIQTPVLKVENAAISYETRRGDVQADEDGHEQHQGRAAHSHGGLRLRADLADEEHVYERLARLKDTARDHGQRKAQNAPGDGIVREVATGHSPRFRLSFPDGPVRATGKP